MEKERAQNLQDALKQWGAELDMDAGQNPYVRIPLPFVTPDGRESVQLCIQDDDFDFVHVAYGTLYQQSFGDYWEDIRVKSDDTMTIVIEVLKTIRQMQAGCLELPWQVRVAMDRAYADIRE